MFEYLKKLIHSNLFFSIFEILCILSLIDALLRYRKGQREYRYAALSIFIVMIFLPIQIFILSFISNLRIKAVITTAYGIASIACAWFLLYKGHKIEIKHRNSQNPGTKT